VEPRARRGEVVLTSLAEAGAWLDFAAGTDGAYLILGEDGLVLGDVEVGKTPLKVAVAPGRYEVRKRTPAGDLAVRVEIAAGEERWIHDSELAPAPIYWQGAGKGEPVPVATPAPADTADGERRKGISELVSGVANLVPTAVLEGSIFAVDKGEATAV